MLGYFYAEKTSELRPKSVGTEKTEVIQEVSEFAPARFNKWRIIGSEAAAYQAGSVYRDNSKRFRFHGWIKPDVNIIDKQASQDIPQNRYHFRICIGKPLFPHIGNAKVRT